MLMITRLELPHQCLMIAQIYINRICACMAQTQFFLTSAIAENIIITSLVIAAKYYQEATEVVVNCDIARILHIQPYRLNQMERILVSLIDQLFVSIHDYNKQACVFNKQIREQMVLDIETRASSSASVVSVANKSLSRFRKKKASSF